MSEHQPAKAADALTDEQIKERCAQAGINWIGDDGDPEGFPGSFDMVSMAEMRALLAASPAKAAEPLEPKANVADGLRRFYLNAEDGYMIETQRGQWVRWVDVQALLAASPATQPPPRGVIVLRNIIALLRVEACYRDDEGEDTDALEDLSKWLEGQQ